MCGHELVYEVVAGLLRTPVYRVSAVTSGRPVCTALVKTGGGSAHNALPVGDGRVVLCEQALNLGLSSCSLAGLLFRIHGGSVASVQHLANGLPGRVLGEVFSCVDNLGHLRRGLSLVERAEILGGVLDLCNGNGEAVGACEK